jgi:hypothetical protein
MDCNKLTSDFNLNRVFRSYTSANVSYDCEIKNADTSKNRKMRKEIARQLTKMNMEKKKKK